MDEGKRLETGMARRRDVLGGAHVDRAAIVEGGFTMEDIKEILFKQAIYRGVPAANHAFALTRKVLDGIATGA